MRQINIYADHAKHFEPLPPTTVPRIEVIDELIAALHKDKPPTHSGHWARGTTAVCLALLESAGTQCEVHPKHQTAPAES